MLDRLALGALAVGDRDVRLASGARAAAAGRNGDALVLAVQEGIVGNVDVPARTARFLSGSCSDGVLEADEVEGPGDVGAVALFGTTAEVLLGCLEGGVWVGPPEGDVG